MKAIIDLKYLLEEELEKIVRKGDITPTELERLDKAVDIIKDIETICAMKEYGNQDEEGYSEYYPRYMREGRGGSYESSYRRGGNSRMGNYMRDPYSYDDGMSYNDSYARSNRSYEQSRDRSYEQSRDRSYEQSRDGSYRGYSGHVSKEDLKKDLEEMMKKAGSEKERMAIQQFLEQWKD